MKLTSKGRYAVTAILDIALYSHRGPVSLSDISDRQHISLSYLEQLFAKLRRQDLVKSVRGPGGGYLLNRSISHISISMIINAVNENIDVTRCLGKGNCKKGSECLTHSLWLELSKRIDEFLNQITIAELVEKHQDKCTPISFVGDFDDVLILDDLPA
ncbi:Fe-S cluster assembly transcriptional regulator IscR [[Haemophilus] felis]|uniref:Fe-S cluster assembly transcriptional regulator IscR n=1 Tax=[Haemophilus] felis TaxID=123822 RepID=A0A1T0BB25_9PAST|nr:Fe-S cluster assembly transcriptional regulator IscR [[Haemophilus] felis]NBI41401.1 Fe-S cluster assembly transcriptional regulator IscR [[Haemophilus] felis]NBI43321.1 Fe-S cluster assembly transcriptional regulator IscR [[Haemophilus] felis]OOS06981.1 Fe-S cluster assembly transcriptional regulator IscR [[Haemophilus] felis]